MVYVFSRRHDRPTQLSFDLTDNCPSLTNGLDVKQYSLCSFVDANPTITFKCRCNKYPKTLPIYIRSDSPFQIRAHDDMVGVMPVTKTLLTTQRPTSFTAATLAKGIHRCSHDP